MDYSTSAPAQDPMAEAMGEMPLVAPTAKGPLPKERLGSPKALQDIFTRMREDDRVNAHNRALCQGQRDGAPPYDQSELIQAGQTDTTNLNFQGADEQAEKAKSPYYKLIHGSENLLSVKTTFGDEKIRQEWETIMAEEISRMIRRWPQFVYQTDKLVDRHVWEGVGIMFWPDDRDWRPRSGGLGQFYFPRGAAVTETEQEIICSYEEYTVTRLLNLIEDPKKAEKAGWNPDAVRQAVTKATASDPAWTDWEKIMQEVKNNDLSTGSKLPVIRIVHGFVEEFDGTVSHYMTTESDCGSKEFLYKNRGVFESMTEVLVLFPWSTGTNTKLHGIRGLGYKVYPFEEQRNRSIGRLIDKGFEASSTMVQPEDEASLANIGLEYMGNLAVLPPGIKIVTSQLPDLQQSVIPAIQMMDQLRDNRTAGYTSQNVFGGDQRKTKAEVMAHLEQSAALTDTSMDFFYEPWRRTLQQITRRISRRDCLPTDPGGKDIAKLKARLERRLVPVEALYRLEWEETMEMRVIGGGSAAAKSLAYERLEPMYERMDDVGRKNFNRNKAVDIVGQSNAEQYFPLDMQPRTTTDTQIAILQNYDLMENREVPVLGTDLHLAHAREHIKPLAQMYEAAESGQMDIAQAATQYMALYVHCEEHVNRIAGDDASIEEANAMRQLLQRIGEIIHNGALEAEEQAQEQQEAEMAEEQGGAVGAQSKDAVQAEFAKAKAQAEIDRYNRTTDAKIEIMQRTAAAKDSIEDAKAAASIMREHRKAKVAPKKPAPSAQ